MIIKRFSSSTSDPILGWLVRNKHLPLVMVFMVLSFLFFFVSAAISVREHVLISKNSATLKEGFLNDFSTVADFLFLNPAIIVSLVLFYRSIDLALSKNNLEKVFSIDNAYGSPILIYGQRLMASRLITAAGILISLLLLVPHYIWLTEQPGHYAIYKQRVPTITGYYILACTFICLIVLNQGLLKAAIYGHIVHRLISSHQIRLDIYNHDGNGGTGVLIAPIINFYYILIFSAVVIILFIAHDIYLINDWLSFRVVMGGIYYFTFFPLCFLMPLFVFRSAMTEFKSEWTERISNKLNLETEFYLARGEHDEKSAKAINELTKLLTVAKDYPNLPLELSSILKWAGAYLLPPIIAATPKIITFLYKLYE